MDPELWRRVESIFARAIDIEPAERDAWLDRVCGEDSELRREVDTLLAADGEIQDPLGDALGEEARHYLAADGREMVGRRVGAWRIERHLGDGGMSSVYLASRADDQFTKQVALKVIQPSMASTDLLRQFQNEKSILARLEHPNIARLLDAGTSEHGQPFFVMEYVDGAPIDVYCEHQQLSLIERLELFRQVCDAVSYAHRNLVIHRDLKPSNILVTAGAVPKLLDFGIAHWLEPPAGTKTDTSPLRLLTPGYASPEQVAGRSMTTASDVYSLGVLLYELLCGQRLHGGADGPTSKLDVPWREPLRRPSDLVGSTLKPRIAGDLDHIVLTALEPEPRRRYASPELLSEDLRRHLEDRPVTARPATLAYRAGKFLRRHKAAVATASAMVALVLGFVVTLMLQSVRLAHERDVSYKERVAAEEVSEFLIRVFHTSESEGETVTARELLDREAKRVSEQMTERESEVQASLMHTLGRVYMELGLPERGAPLLEKALELRRAKLDPEHPAIGDSLNRLAILWAETGEYERAEELFREGLDRRRKLFGPGDHDAIASSLNNLALVLHEQGEYRDALPLYREALEMSQRLVGRRHPDTALEMDNLGFALYDLGAYEEAEALFREAIEVRREFSGHRRSELAESLWHLGQSLSAQGEFEAAEPHLQEAMQLLGALSESEHIHLARAQHALATHLLRRGRPEEATELYQRSLELRREHFKEKHPEEATSLSGLGAALIAAGRSEEAETHLREAMALQRELLPSNHPELASTLCELGRLLASTGRPGAAVPLLEEALDIRSGALWPEDLRLAEVRSLLADTRPTGSSPTRRRPSSGNQ